MIALAISLSWPTWERLFLFKYGRLDLLGQAFYDLDISIIGFTLTVTRV